MNTINKYSILLVVLIFSALSSFAQNDIELHITHRLNGQDLQFNTATKNDLGNDFNITRLEYYISNISITHDGGMTTDIPNHYILADGSQPVQDNLGQYNITSVEAVSFYIGVDTPINHADPSLQPSGHPLAPKMPSMHWGWAAGYRFVALEGKSGSGLGQTYEIHALEDSNYMQTTVNVTATAAGGKVIIPIAADYAMAVKGVDLSQGVISHGGNNESDVLLNNFSQSVFKPWSPVSVEEVNTASDIQVYPNPASGLVNIITGTEEANISVFDIQGRTVHQQVKALGIGHTTIELNNPGMYILKVESQGQNTIIKKLQVL